MKLLCKKEILCKKEYNGYVKFKTGSLYENEEYEYNALCLIRDDEGFGEWFSKTKYHPNTSLYIWDYFYSPKELLLKQRKEKLKKIND